MSSSRALVFSDFHTKWYKKWASKLKQDEKNRGDYSLYSNKFWQNAAIINELDKFGKMKSGKKGIGFGVGNERLPALFASMGIDVLATDQDFESGKAQSWDNGQLAKDASSLDIHGICPDYMFKYHVSYRSLDMNKIPSDIDGAFDYLWSNCALGHLGSIRKGLKFIENSLSTLLPGGVAVHTTECNVLSNSSTVDNEGTVVFRQKDILNLFMDLTKKGYICEPLVFDLGKEKDDMRYTLSPEFGNDYSKLQVSGNIATQIILVIRKPLLSPNRSTKQKQILEHRLRYIKNLRLMKSYLRSNKQLREMINWNSSSNTTTECRIEPIKKHYSINLVQNTKKTIKIRYRNNSSFGLFGLHTNLGTDEYRPLVLGTNDPINRKSNFSDKSWYTKNRPSVTPKTKDAPMKVGVVYPGSEFYFDISLNSHKLKKGNYEERLILIKEWDGVIPNTEVILNIVIS